MAVLCVLAAVSCAFVLRAAASAGGPVIKADEQQVILVANQVTIKVQLSSPLRASRTAEHQRNSIAARRSVCAVRRRPSTREWSRKAAERLLSPSCPAGCIQLIASSGEIRACLLL